VFSDDDIKYGTQDTLDWYRARTIGIPDFRKKLDPISGYGKRRVLTTRRDGTMTFVAQPNGRYVVTTERNTGSHYCGPWPQVSVPSSRLTSQIGLGLPMIAPSALGLGL
jgi:hypothetical protein